MLPSLRSTGSKLAARASQANIPDFLLPAFTPINSSRPFSNSSRSASRIGAAPLSVPSDVTLTLIEPVRKRGQVVQRVEPPRVVAVKGPLGDLTIEVPHYMTFVHDAETRKATLQVQDKDERKQREMWGTTRATLNNHILGVSEGHSAILRLVGVGFRATIESKAVTKEPSWPGQQFVNLKVGYSHPIELPIPAGVKVTIPQPTRILLEGANNEDVKQFAAEIRAWRKPEPYKGKGIFVNDETIRLKAKKIK